MMIKDKYILDDGITSHAYGYCPISADEIELIQFQFLLMDDDKFRRVKMHINLIIDIYINENY